MPNPMKDELVRALDGRGKLAVVLADCTAAADALARAHLSGPTASAYLAQAAAGAALLGSETSETDETVTFKLQCPGPLEGFLLECTEKGTLRGYTNKKVLNDFDGAVFKDADVIGETGTVEVIRSVPGRILASGATATAFADRDRKGPGFVAQALDAYYAQSLQRRVRTLLVGTAGDDGVPVYARGVSVECPPDGDVAAFEAVVARLDDGTFAKALSGATISARTLLKKLGLADAEIRGRSPLAFACRCSGERARDMIAALPPAARADLPETVDITCHMCGRIWTVQTV